MKNLWRVPVLCLAGSWVGFYLTVYLGQFFFVVKTVEEDGNMIVSADPVRSLIFSLVLFFLILVIGGLFLLRSMTKKEIALSAAIISGIYLILTVVQINFKLHFNNVNFNALLSIFQTWPNILTKILYQVTGKITIFFTFLCCFSPFLFVFFGKSKE